MFGTNLFGNDSLNLGTRAIPGLGSGTNDVDLLWQSGFLDCSEFNSVVDPVRTCAELSAATGSTCLTAIGETIGIDANDGGPIEWFYDVFCCCFPSSVPSSGTTSSPGGAATSGGTSSGTQSPPNPCGDCDPCETPYCPANCICGGPVDCSKWCFSKEVVQGPFTLPASDPPTSFYDLMGAVVVESGIGLEFNQQWWIKKRSAVDKGWSSTGVTATGHPDCGQNVIEYKECGTGRGAETWYRVCTVDPHSGVVHWVYVTYNQPLLATKSGAPCNCDAGQVETTEPPC